MSELTPPRVRPRPPINKGGRKRRAGQSLCKVYTDREFRKCLNVLQREIKSLLELSYQGPLTRDQSTALVNYTKLLKELKKQEEEELK